jgi:hypothetical protein
MGMSEAGDIFSSWEEEMDGRWNIIGLSTETFRGQAVNFMSMSVDDVGKMFGEKVHGPAAMIAAIRLLKKCIVDETDRQRFEELSFAEALEVVSQWHVLSTKAEEERSKKNLAQKIEETKTKMKEVLESVGLPTDLLDGIELENGTVIGEHGDSEDDDSE